MNPPIEPGGYLANVPGPDGCDVAICRCPVCWCEFAVAQEGKPEIVGFHPLALECVQCHAYRSYRNVNRNQIPPRDFQKRHSGVRRRYPGDNTPLFG